MYKQPRASFAAILTGGALLFIAADGLQAQNCVYSFAEYDNVYSDGVSLYSTVTVDDYSGCNHSQYTTTAIISSPSGRNSSVASGGLESEASLSVSGEYGNYTTATSGRFYCPAAHGFAGFGNGWTVNIALAQTGFKWPLLAKDSGGNWYCKYKTLSCDVNDDTPRCTSGSWTTVTQPVPPCPDQILVEWLRVTLLGTQTCFAVGFDNISGGPPPDCY